MRIPTVVMLCCLALTLGCASQARVAEPEATETIPPAEPQQAPATDEEAEEEPLTNTLRWTTASEVDNFGFDIYRGLSEDGPFECITEEPISGAGTTDEPQSYVYVDDTIDPTKRYYYYIESISMQSVRERFSPIVAVDPKKPAPEE